MNNAMLITAIAQASSGSPITSIFEWILSNILNPAYTGLLMIIGVLALIGFTTTLIALIVAGQGNRSRWAIALCVVLGVVLIASFGPTIINFFGSFGGSNITVK